MKERLGWIDIAKGICLIAVIIGHMGIEQAGFVYSFHLTTFFILSGYTLRKTDLTAQYVNQKFKRLMVLMCPLSSRQDKKQKEYVK